MEELIKITEQNGQKAVNARGLHEFLEVKTRFNDWITRRIEQYDLIEGVDFIPLTQNRVSGGLEKEYVLSVDAAKELSMVEGNEKGKQARKYFIECEKKFNQVQCFQIPQTFSQALMLAAKQAEQIEEQQKAISIMAPKAEYFDCLVDRQLNVNFRDTAKELGVKQTDFINWMLGKRYVYRDVKKQVKPYAQYVESGLFAMKEYGNERHAGVQTLITPKGRETFRLLYN